MALPVPQNRGATQPPPESHRPGHVNGNDLSGVDIRSVTGDTRPEFSQSGPAATSSYYHHDAFRPSDSAENFLNLPGLPRFIPQQMNWFSTALYPGTYPTEMGWRSEPEGRSDTAQARHGGGPTSAAPFAIPPSENLRAQENTTAPSHRSEMRPPAHSLYGLEMNADAPSSPTRPSFACPYKHCFCTLSSNEDLQTHETEHVRRNECKACGRGFMYRKDLVRHCATHGKSRQRLPCEICPKTFPRLDHLQRHLRGVHKLLSNDERMRYRNKKYTCAECKEAFADCTDHDWHRKTLGHTKIRCQECEIVLDDFDELYRHKQSTGHSICKQYKCEEPGCMSKFKYKDTLQRHIQTVHAENMGQSGIPVKTFPCKFCRRHRGANAFKRKDHLAQHLTGYHHQKSCERVGCPDWRPKTTIAHAFRSEAEYLEHRRDAHGGLDRDCIIKECDRRGTNGFTTSNDMWKHYVRYHLDYM